MDHRAWATLALFLLLSSGGLNAQPITLTFIHVNDTHSHFDPAQVRLTVDLDDTLKGKALTVELGGFPQAAETIAALKREAVNPLVVHGGDFFQGTLYFTQSSGVADTDFWNSVGLDAATLGNHEFDLGALTLRKNFLEKATFPVVSANIDWSKNAVLGPVVRKPFVVKVVGGEKVGFVGLTTTETPYISSPGPDLLFNEYAASVQSSVAALKAQKVDKIVVVSHIGYDEDKKLAAAVPGIDVIVGGHSHTLLGDWTAVGLKSSGDYPTVIQGAEGPVLIVQSWEWAKVIGDLAVNFDAAGKVISWKASPRAVVGPAWFRLFDVPGPDGILQRLEFNGDLSSGNPVIKWYDGKVYQSLAPDAAAFYQAYWKKIQAWMTAHPALRTSAGDPAAIALAKVYAGKVDEMRAKVAAEVGQDLVRGLNSGPGPVVAEAYAFKTGSQIALSNPGGIRTNLLAGPLTVAGVYELIPFGNTLVTMKATGAQVVAAVEDGIDFSLTRYGEVPVNPLIYESGLKFVVDLKAPKGARLSQVQVRQPDGTYVALDPKGVYSMVVNNFMAAGGDKYDTVKAIDGKIDTGYIDAEALLDYVRGKTLGAQEQRITVAP